MIFFYIFTKRLQRRQGPSLPVLVLKPVVIALRWLAPYHFLLKGCNGGRALHYRFWFKNRQ